jgi:hypothetical protein
VKETVPSDVAWPLLAAVGSSGGTLPVPRLRSQAGVDLLRAELVCAAPRGEDSSEPFLEAGDRWLRRIPNVRHREQVAVPRETEVLS